jgi:hypothetical protein
MNLVPQGAKQIAVQVPLVDFINNYIPKRADFTDIKRWSFKVSNA